MDTVVSSSHPMFICHLYIVSSKVLAILEMARLLPTPRQPPIVHQLAAALKSLSMRLKVVLQTPPKIPLKMPRTPRTPQMPTYWIHCQKTIRRLLTWNRMAPLRHGHWHERRPSSQHRPRQDTQYSQKLTLQVSHQKFLSSASHLVTLALPFLV